MKRIFVIALALSLALPLAGQQALPGKHFTDEELLGRMPEGIVKPTPFVAGFTDDALRYSVGRDGYSYSIKTGVSTPATLPPRMRPASREELVPGWVNPTWSPDSTKIAFTLKNDLYSIDVYSKHVTRHTYDGSDLILNGYASWVYYEEIFGRPSQYRAFW